MENTGKHCFSLSMRDSLNNIAQRWNALPPKLEAVHCCWGLTTTRWGRGREESSIGATGKPVNVDSYQLQNSKLKLGSPSLPHQFLLWFSHS